MSYGRRISIWLVLLLGVAAPVFAGGDFRVMRGTESPDGAYALGYGRRNSAVKRMADLQEAPAEDPEFDQAIRREFEKSASNMPEGIVDYLIELKTKRAVLILPDWHSCPGNNYPAMEIGWSADSQQALVINPSRWGWNAIAWIDLRARHATPVGKMLDSQFRQYLARHRKRAYADQARQLAVTFGEPSIPRPRVLVLGIAEATVPKGTAEEGFQYQLTFRNVSRSGRPEFILTAAQRTDE